LSFRLAASFSSPTTGAVGQFQLDRYSRRLLFSLLGVQWFGWGLIWCWFVFTGWLCMMGSIYLARFLQGRWQSMRVIESEVEAQLDRELALPVAGPGDLPVPVTCETAG
jgi:hypothetical protein